MKRIVSEIDELSFTRNINEEYIITTKKQAASSKQPTYCLFFFSSVIIIFYYDDACVEFYDIELLLAAIHHSFFFQTTNSFIHSRQEGVAERKHCQSQSELLHLSPSTFHLSPFTFHLPYSVTLYHKKQYHTHPHIINKPSTK